MSNYIGVKCPVCNKKFSQTDDIVVCPVCGAPHHRECYAQKNACAFAADHLSGKEWRAPPPDPARHGEDGAYSTHNNGSYGGEPSGEDVACSACQSKNPKGAIFCQVCGTRMSFDSESFFNNQYMHIDPVSMVYGGLRPDEKIEDETARDLAIYIGPGSAYYLPRFKKIADAYSSLTFSLSALLFNFLFFFYRKMYFIGGILLGFFIIGAIPSYLHTQELLPQIMHQYFGVGPEVVADQAKVAYYQQLINMTSTINLILSVLLAFFANRFYYAKAMNDIKRIREAQPEKHNEAAYCGELREKGGVSKLAVIIVAAVCFVIYLISAFYMSYQYLQAGGYPLQ